MVEARIRRLVNIAENFSTEDLNIILALKSLQNYCEFVVDTMDPREGFDHKFDEDGVLRPDMEAALSMGEDMYNSCEQKGIIKDLKEQQGFDLTSIYTVKAPSRKYSVNRKLGNEEAVLSTKEYKA